MDKLLTITIPAYNSEQYLEKCVDSIVNSQNAEKIEIIIVNDGSRDNTLKIANSYHEHYPDIIKVIDKPNGGHGSAVNSGIVNATGKYFKVVDSDDWVDTAELDKLIGKLATFDCDLIVTPFVTDTDGRKKLRKTEVDKHIPFETLLPFSEVAETAFIRMHEITIKTSVLVNNNIRLWEKSFYVDMQYTVFPIPWIKTVCFLNLPVYQYRLGRGEQSVSMASMQKNRLQHLGVLSSLIDFYLERENIGEKKEVLHYFAKIIARMEANQVQTILSLPICEESKQELVETEKLLEQRCPEAVKLKDTSLVRNLCLGILRGCNYKSYKFVARCWRLLKKQ